MNAERVNPSAARPVAFDLRGLESRIEALDAHLRPIVGRTADVDAAPVLRDVATLSSDENRMGMGSVREWLLRAADAGSATSRAR
jgi:hypothetical protein